MQHEDRDAVFIRAVVASVADLLRAIERDSNPEIASAMTRLLWAALKFRDALAERPDDAAVRRAVTALNRSDKHAR